VTPRASHIVALGGGGFSMEPRNPRLDDYVLGLARVRRPRVGFVATASGDSPTYVDRFLRAFPRSRARASVLRLFQREVSDLDAFVRAQHVVYVGGGNTVNLLAVWRAHGLDLALRRAWRAGTVLAGVSAGALCWFEGGTTDSFGGLAPLHDGLGFLPGSFCPHYDGEARRRPLYHAAVHDGLPPGWACDDGAAVHFVGRRFHAAVASREGAKAYRVTRERGRVVERAVAPEILDRVAPRSRARRPRGPRGPR
jgi:peptidase E